MLASNIPFEQVGQGTWILRDPDWGGAQIVVHHADTLVIYRVKLCDLPEQFSIEKQAALFRHLLHLNATEMMQGAYALEGNIVTAVEVMQIENLDLNEFTAALESLTTAIVFHREEISALLK